MVLVMPLPQEEPVKNAAASFGKLAVLIAALWLVGGVPAAVIAAILFAVIMLADVAARKRAASA
jgi:hypothetical protein